MKNQILKLLLVIFVITLSSCEKEENPITITPDKYSTLEIEFDNVFGEEDFAFDKSYKLTNGTDVKINTLKYFISNIVLHKSGNIDYIIPQDSSYFLLDESNPNSTKLSLNVPEGDYTGFSFIIGVDSLRNTMPIENRTGPLDISGDASGMYWSWNSGYIFFKMEGEYSNFDKSGMFKYHIGLFGGYSSPTLNNIKNVKLSFGDSIAKVRTNQDVELHVIADLKKAFEGKNNMNLIDNPTIMGSPISAKVADNYATMFKFDHIH